MSRNNLALFVVLSMIAIFSARGWSQNSSPEVNQGASISASSPDTTDTKLRRIPEPEGSKEKRFPSLLTDFASDQKQIWSSPSRIRLGDATWLVPLGGLAAGLFATDRDYSASLSHNPSTISHYKTVSNLSVGSLIAAGAGMYLFSFPMHKEHWRETGWLAGEAALNSLIVTEAFKYSLARQRPYQGNGAGSFFSGGTSFPSEHAAAAWSIAGVIAHEYPGAFPTLFAYSAAAAVDFSRIHGRQHFPSDVLVGSVMGYLIAQSVYRRHHEPETGGGAWEMPSEFVSQEARQSPRFMGSPAVPLDSWVYPALERLAALGYINTGYLGIRPWTRFECARLVQEAGEKIFEDESESGATLPIYRALASEFFDETDRMGGAPNQGISLDSVYTRVTGISGTPLRDGYHFGQTLINDYGRPYGEGFNNITGISAHAVAGALSFYVRGEYQHAPSTPSYSPATQIAVANADFTAPVSNATAQLDRFHLVDASVALTVNNIQLSFGKQSLWLGPGESGSLLLSNNADSITMMRIQSVSPFKVPLVSTLLGPMHAEYFLGQLGGTQFELNGSTLLGPGGISPQPVLSGYKASFKPTPNFEFGMGVTAQFVGPGLPFTWKNFVRTFYAHNQTGPTVTNANPGKRISSLDFTYRIPWVRDWLTVYGDTLVVDEVSPIGSTRATVNPGIYMPRLPKLHKFEFRAEGIHEPVTREFAPGFVYYGERRYRSGYTNEGNLMGNWIGRAGQGAQAWLTYSISPRKTLQFAYRHQEVSKDFIGGGRSNDYTFSAQTMIGQHIGLSSWIQGEQWRFPMLAATKQSNITTSLQVTFYPGLHRQR